MRTTALDDRRRPRAAAGAAAALALGLSIATATGSFAAAPRASAAAAAPACATSGLVVWLDTNGNAAAGSIYYTLEFTNLSGHPCTLAGYPGVSAVDLGGRTIGAAASRDTSATPHTVTLGSGPNATAATATATLRIVESGNFPSSSCGPVAAAGLRVYPPNQRASKIVPFPFGACSHAADVVLSVRAVR